MVVIIQQTHQNIVSEAVPVYVYCAAFQSLVVADKSPQEVWRLHDHTGEMHLSQLRET